ncbi:MAG TPA: 23S rRNA (adenine(2503)-C(2))-methyltransferase RlmN [Candidatus Acidoferrum sp.]
MSMVELLGKSKEELRAFCVALGEPAYRGGQIYHALYAERKVEFARMTNLPLALRQRLANDAQITLPEVRQRFFSTDRSVRYLFGLRSAQEQRFNTEDLEEERTEETEKNQSRSGRTQLPASVEAVFMPSEGRQTICISTQAGCAVDCHFCLTAQLGLIRNLTAGEIVSQVLVVLEEQRTRNEENVAGLEPKRKSGSKIASEANAPVVATQRRSGPNPRPSKDHVDTQTRSLAATQATGGVQTNVVLMGQGEPLLNFEPVMAALGIMLDPEGIGLSPKHVTLSTSGIVPGIQRLAEEKARPKLAISLNASSDEERDALMPVNKKYPLKLLLEACRNYPLRPWEHLTFEYVMLGDLNDSPDDARRIVKLLAPLKRVKVNLIPWNPGELPYRESSPERVEEFRRILTDKAIPAFVRYSRGRDVMAACGQLALKEVHRSPLTVLSKNL